jgi:hypothetical protein
MPSMSIPFLLLRLVVCGVLSVLVAYAGDPTAAVVQLLL